MMNEKQNKDPLHGVKLEQILIHLVDYYGWYDLGKNRYPLLQQRSFHQVQS